MHRDTLIAWLNDAHAMETQLLPVLRNHAQDMKGNPVAQRRIEEHVRETEQHAERVRQAVELLGSNTSTIKSGLASVMGMAQSVSTGIFSDELVKNALTDYAAEQFEVAAYKALIAAADEMGETGVSALCAQNLREDEAMAVWLDQQLPIVVRKTLQKLATTHR
jgi:ferritin-like metal-binding protein YciE